MLEFRLKQPLAFPGGRAPRLNRTHPLFSQAHFLNAAVARGKGMLDLVTGVFAGGTTTLTGNDESGPYVYSNDNAGTAECTFPVVATAFQFLTWGCIFKLAPGSMRGYCFTADVNTGLFVSAQTINFLLGNATWAAFTGVAGHAYFAFANSATGSAGGTRTATLVDLNTGQVFQTRVAVTGGNSPINPVAALVPYSTFVIATRVYAMFASGSTLAPPAVQPAATFYSLDMIMGGLSNPWALWYA
jgi:hypothetical protein